MGFIAKFGTDVAHRCRCGSTVRSFEPEATADDYKRVMVRTRCEGCYEITSFWASESEVSDVKKLNAQLQNQLRAERRSMGGES